ncbi:MAG: hypothetical protein HY892_21435 [Deltaproteobacteria bacterium]|nr:hypothetical protein [Deltaproteobacteria bacterium]
MAPVPSRLQWRIQNCLHTILEVHEHMGGKTISPEIIQQLEDLKELIHRFEPATLTETDLRRIEASTNLLLQELAKVFRIKNLGPIHSGYRN